MAMEKEDRRPITTVTAEDVTLLGLPKALTETGKERHGRKNDDGGEEFGVTVWRPHKAPTPVQLSGVPT
jgi:hypothetical protein